MKFSDSDILGKYHSEPVGVTAVAFEAQMEAVREAMNDPVLTAEEQLERKADWIIRELDELCAMAANKETIDLVEGQRFAIGQMLVRTQLIVGFLLAGKQHLKVVPRG